MIFEVSKNTTGLLGVRPCDFVNGIQLFVKHAAPSVGVYGHDLTAEAALSPITPRLITTTCSVIYNILEEEVTCLILEFDDKYFTNLEILFLKQICFT